MLLDFFFFKQKTAYEMRISDWSSDVCSSDLHRRGWAGEPIAPLGLALHAETGGRDRVDAAGAVLTVKSGSFYRAMWRWHFYAEIGRGSGRERVGQYG